MMVEQKLISVIMSVFDTPDDWLAQSIESILQQTYQNIEFIIIDDCCKESNKKILNFFKEKDKRIVLLKNEKNLGLTKSLNRGLRIAHGDFIARIDADDLALPDRFERQLKCFSVNKKLVICGTSAWILKDAKKIPFDVPVISSKSLKCMLCWNDVFIHPSVMLNAGIMRKNNLFYDECFKTAQDYELWCRLSKFGDVMNMHNRLCIYRVHEKQVSFETSVNQALNRNKIILKNLNTLGLDCDEEKLNIYLAIMGYEEPKLKFCIIMKETILLCCKMIVFYGPSSFYSVFRFVWNGFWLVKHSACGDHFRFFSR